jgi:hypothetical protein
VNAVALKISTRLHKLVPKSCEPARAEANCSGQTTTA